MNKAQLINEALQRAAQEEGRGRGGRCHHQLYSKLNKKRGKSTAFGFGTFETKVRGARTGRNPKTGETVMIPSADTRYSLPARR